MMRRTLLLTLAVALAAPATAQAALPHVVGPGETLWSIAAANNLTTRTVAVYNGLAEDSHVVLGSTIMVPTVAEGAAKLATAAPAAPAGGAPPPAGAYTVRPGDTFSALAAPVPTSGRVTAGDIQAVAGQHGVPGSLAAAIAWQESGFNNAMVSSANARGVMQVMPGTWDWVQENLASRPLDPSNPHDNVHAGTMYLGQLLRDTGGDPALAAAGYYQGLSSVREIGMLPETRRYVENVMALRGRFGG